MYSKGVIIHSCQALLYVDFLNWSVHDQSSLGLYFSLSVEARRLDSSSWFWSVSVVVGRVNAVDQKRQTKFVIIGIHVFFSVLFSLIYSIHNCVVAVYLSAGLLKLSVNCEPQYRLVVQCLLESEVVSSA